MISSVIRLALGCNGDPETLDMTVGHESTLACSVIHHNLDVQVPSPIYKKRIGATFGKCMLQQIRKFTEKFDELLSRVDEDGFL